mmetsp:Transcript_14625/g.33833  ORF Transcript_14625/g.33833 Transcript_14625/m.33833 type:complete len:85 (+) Transcript_14625:737-991(+)
MTQSVKGNLPVMLLNLRRPMILRNIQVSLVGCRTVSRTSENPLTTNFLRSAYSVRRNWFSYSSIVEWPDPTHNLTRSAPSARIL